MSRDVRVQAGRSRATAGLSRPARGGIDKMKSVIELGQPRTTQATAPSNEAAPGNADSRKVAERVPVKRTRARNLCHLSPRLIRKVLGHTVAAWTNLSHSRRPLDIDGLAE